VRSKIAGAAIQDMTWPDGILQEVCEKLGSCGPSDMDSPLFKGVYVRYLGEFAVNLATVDDPARVQAAQQYASFLQLNADTLWANYPGQIFGMDWHTPSLAYQPTGVPVYDGCLQMSALDLFISAALVSS
jgi:predicted alpha-1,6-mannanase (GH76 family)